MHNMNGALLNSLWVLMLCFRYTILPHWYTVLKYRSYDCYVKHLTITKDEPYNSDNQNVIDFLGCHTASREQYTVYTFFR